MQTRVQDRLVGGVAAALVVTVFGYLLLLGTMVEIGVDRDRPMILVDLHAPPPARHPRAPRSRQPASRAASGRASPRNLRGKPAEILVPPPLLMVPPPPPLIVSAPTVGIGMAHSAGASDQPGRGQGASGQGSGLGGGGNGGEGTDSPPRLIRGRLKFADLPADLRDARTGGAVAVRYRVDIDGRVHDCTIEASSGIAELDAETCRLIELRFRYRPSHDARGRAVRSTIEESHSWIFDVGAALPPRG